MGKQGLTVFIIQFCYPWALFLNFLFWEHYRFRRSCKTQCREVLGTFHSVFPGNSTFHNSSNTSNPGHWHWGCVSVCVAQRCLFTHVDTCDHPCSQDSGLCHSPQRYNLSSPFTGMPTLLPRSPNSLNPWQPRIHSSSLKCQFGNSSKWNHTVYDLLWLALLLLTWLKFRWLHFIMRFPIFTRPTRDSLQKSTQCAVTERRPHTFCWFRVGFSKALEQKGKTL